MTPETRKDPAGGGTCRWLYGLRSIKLPVRYTCVDSNRPTQGVFGLKSGGERFITVPRDPPATVGFTHCCWILPTTFVASPSVVLLYFDSVELLYLYGVVLLHHYSCSTVEYCSCRCNTFCGHTPCWWCRVGGLFVDWGRRRPLLLLCLYCFALAANLLVCYPLLSSHAVSVQRLCCCCRCISRWEPLLADATVAAVQYDTYGLSKLFPSQRKIVFSALRPCLAVP